MKHWTLQIRRKPSENEDVSVVHDMVVRALTVPGEPWNLSMSVPRTARVQSGEVVAVCQMRFDNPAISGWASYPFRGRPYLQDKGKHDDLIVLEIDSDRIDLSSVGDRAIPHLVTTISPYRAALVHNETSQKDWKDIKAKMVESGRDVNGRHGVWRFVPSMFIEKTLFEAELGVKMETFLANDSSGDCRFLHGGVFINRTKDLKDLNRYLQFDSRFRTGGCRG